MICGVFSSVSPQSPFNSFLIQIPNFPKNPLLFSSNLSISSPSSSLRPIYCSSSSGPGENDSKTVLDAFFLGKALGEALTERVESAVGEVLSTIGRLQAEQQKQVLEFQEDVFERAKKAKEKAAREALEAQGRFISNSTVRTASEKNGSVSSAPTSVVNLDELGSVGDENITNSEASGLVTRIRKDE